MLRRLLFSCKLLPNIARYLKWYLFIDWILKNNNFKSVLLFTEYVFMRFPLLFPGGLKISSSSYLVLLDLPGEAHSSITHMHANLSYRGITAAYTFLCHFRLDKDFFQYLFHFLFFFFIIWVYPSSIFSPFFFLFSFECLSVQFLKVGYFSVPLPPFLYS